MNDFIQSLFSKDNRISNLKDKVKKQYKELKYLKTVVDSHEEKADYSRRLLKREEIYSKRDIEDLEDNTAREIENVRNEVFGKVDEIKKEKNRELEEMKFNSERDIERENDNSDNKIRRIKEEFEHREKMLKEKTESSMLSRINTEKTSLKEKYDDRIESLNASLIEESIISEKERAISEERTVVIDSLRQEIERYSDFTKYILTLLPKVDLTKFNINVDVPASKVVVESNKCK